MLCNTPLTANLGKREAMTDAGTHLIVDGYVKDNAVFTEEKFTHLFEILADTLQMKIIKGPDFVSVPTDPEILERVTKTGNFEDSGGTTGFCIVSTSHMSIHCWPLENFFSLDVFSCKKYDAEKAIAVISRELNISAVRTHTIDRRRPDLPATT